MLCRLSPERIRVDPAVGRARARRQQRRSDRSTAASASGFGVGAGVGRRRRGRRSGVGDGVGVGVGLGGRRARRRRSAPRRTARWSRPPALDGAGRRATATRPAACWRSPADGMLEPAVGRRRKPNVTSGERREGRGDRRRQRASGARPRPAGTGVSADRAAQIARAVDVAAGQADELLLAQRLRDRARPSAAQRLAASGASIGGPMTPFSSARKNGQMTGFAIVPARAAARSTARGRRRWARRQGPSAGRRAGPRPSSRRPTAGFFAARTLRAVGGLDGAESSTFGAVAVPTDGVLGSAARTDRTPVRPARIEAHRRVMALPLPVIPPQPDALSPRAAPHQALHVPAADPGRERAASGSTTSSACSPIAGCRSPWATSTRRPRSATPARRRTPSAPTRTEPRRGAAAGVPRSARERQRGGL